MKSNVPCSIERSLGVLVILVMAAITVEAKVIFSEFSGYREWPLEKASMADASYAIPVYRTWPDKPYVVFGSLKFGDPNASWNDGDIRQIAKEARKRKAEALILRFGAESAVFGLTPEAVPSGGFINWQPSALLVRFKTAEEIRAEELNQRELFEAFRAKCRAEAQRQLAGDATFSEDTAKLAVKFLLQSGLKLNDPSFPERFSITMARVSTDDGKELSGEWLFKVDYQNSTLTGSDTDTAFGIAEVKADADGIVIISKEGGAELNFSGTQTGGRVSGQMGVYRASSRAEGALVKDKISLTFSTTTASGAVRCTVVFQRSAIPRRLLVPAPRPEPSLKKT